MNPHSAEGLTEKRISSKVRKKAALITATNILNEQRLAHEQVIGTYKEQGGVERGFRFLKDPVFLASSVFVKKPERVIALSFIMVLCLLVYRLAEHLLRRQLSATEQTVPNQINKPINRPTMRWIFQCLVQPHSVVDNSDFCPSCLTARSTRLMLAS